MQKTKHKLFSVTMSDCKLDTFTVKGPGGGGKDTGNSGVRITHLPSGAIGEGREERHQHANKQRAFRKMAESPKMQAWIKLEVARKLNKPVELSEEEIMAKVDRMISEGIKDGSIRIEEVEALA